MTQLLTLNILGLSLLSSRPSNLSPISWNTPCPILDPHFHHTFSVKKFNQLHRKSARHCNNAPLIGQNSDEVWDLKASSIWELGNGSHHRIILSSLGNSTQKPKIPQTRRDVHVTAIPTKGNFGVNDIPPHRPSSGKASERDGEGLRAPERHRSEAGDLSYIGTSGGRRHSTKRYASAAEEKPLRPEHDRRRHRFLPINWDFGWWRSFIGQNSDEVWDLKASSIWELGNGSHHRIILSSLGNSTQKPKIPQTRRDVHVTAIPTKGNFGVNDIPPHRPSSGKASERHRSEAGDLSYVGKVKRRQRQISYSQKGTFRLTDNLRKRVDLPALAHLWANETIGQSCVSFACKRVGQSPRPLQTCWPIISLSCVPKLFGQCSEATLSH